MAIKAGPHGHTVDQQSPLHANATHASLLDDEADAAVASEAIYDVVVAVCSSRRLAPR